MLSPELNKLLLYLGIGLVSFSAIIGIFAKKIRNSFKPFSKRAIWYLLISVAIFAVTGLFIATRFFSGYNGYFIFFQVLFLLYGGLHIYMMHKKMDWGKEKQTFVPDLIFTFIILLAGAICFMLAYRWLNREGLEISMMFSTLFFIIPLFVWHTFLSALAIPPKVLNQWYYPVHEPMEDPEESKLKNMLLISFEFQKNGQESFFTNFRAKAPVDMELGELFYYFINDYNERHPQGQIHFSNGTGKPYGWMFYKKPKWYTIMTTYMDSEKTIYLNRIKENDVIVCSRIIEN
ncbi:MAG TPA: TssN family type VI secretion system protein [Niastella sp.]